MLEAIREEPIKRDSLFKMFADTLGDSDAAIPRGARVFQGHVTDFPAARFQHSYPEDFNKKGVNWQGMWKSVGLEMPPTGLANDQKAVMVVRADGQKDLSLTLAGIHYKAANHIEVKWDVTRSDPTADAAGKKCPYAVVILPRDVEVKHKFNTSDAAPSHDGGVQSTSPPAAQHHPGV